jgi:hypothetical protein
MDWHGESEILNKFVPILNAAGIDIMLCGHLHRHLKLDANDRVNFPVLVNSNNAVVKGVITSQSLSIDVLEPDGKTTDKIVIHK